MTKPRKVEEPATPYTATPKEAKRPAGNAAQIPSRKTIRYADDAAFRKAADKVFKTHDELFRKLAQ